jgi:glycosyltransferase involved in cell wall biosynthesis
VDISVIVPVFNGGSKLHKCIRALKRQNTDRTFEIIVVDDGSNDGSLKNVQGNNIRILRQANQGPAAARNLGVAESRGKVVLFTDADCEPLENWIAEMLRPLKDPTIAAVKGSYLSKQTERVSRLVQLEYETKYERMKRDRYIDFIDTYSAGFVKKYFLSVGQYDLIFPTPSVEDQEFSFRMWRAGHRMVFNPDAKVYHTHVTNLKSYVKKKFRIGFWKALVLRKHPEKIFRDSHTPQTLKLEMIFATLLLGFLFCSLFYQRFLVYALLPLLGFLITITPFVITTLRKEPRLALFSPLFLFCRALALSAGLLAGSVKVLLKRKGKAGGAEVKSADRSPPLKT